MSAASTATTAERIALADRFVAALAARDAIALATLLAADAWFERLNRRVDGGDAVLDELLGAPGYGRLDWGPARAEPHGIVVVGASRAPAAEPGLVLTLDVRDHAVHGVAQQRTPPVAPAPRPLALTPAMKTLIDTALAERRPIVVAHVDPDGQPVLSFRGSLHVLDDTRLGLWIRNADGRFLASIEANPRVAMMVRDEASKATYQLQGRARVVDDAPLRERIHAHSPLAERQHDFARLGVAVVVELDRVDGYAGLGPAGAIDRVVMQRDAHDRSPR